MKFKAITVNKTVGQSEQTISRKVSQHNSFLLEAVRQEFSRQDEKETLSRIQRAQKEIAYYNSLITRESSLNEQLRLGLKGFQREEEQKIASELKAQGSGQQSLLKTLRRQESELQKITHRVNEVKALIANHKQHINHAREERSVYSNIFKNMEKELHQQLNQIRQILLQKKRLGLETAEEGQVDRDPISEEREERDQEEGEQTRNEPIVQGKSHRSNLQFSHTLFTSIKQIKLKSNLQEEQGRQNLLRAIRIMGYQGAEQFLQNATRLQEERDRAYQRHQTLSQEVATLKEQLKLAQAQISHFMPSPYLSSNQSTSKDYQKALQQLGQLEQQSQSELGRLESMMVTLNPLFQVLGVRVPVKGSRAALCQYEEAVRLLQAQLLLLQDQPVAALQETSITLKRPKQSSELQAILAVVDSEKLDDSLIGEAEMKQLSMSKLMRTSLPRRTRLVKKKNQH